LVYRAIREMSVRLVDLAFRVRMGCRDLRAEQEQGFKVRKVLLGGQESKAVKDSKAESDQDFRGYRGTVACRVQIPAYRGRRVLVGRMVFKGHRG
jgi:hypothetical protein